MIAEMDNGAGPGVYRKENCPQVPVHPNCMCMLVPYVGELPEKMTFKTFRDYLVAQPDRKRADIIGKANAVNPVLYRRGLEKRGLDPDNPGVTRRIPAEIILQKNLENVEKSGILSSGGSMDEVAELEKFDGDITQGGKYKPLTPEQEFKKVAAAQDITAEERAQIWSHDGGHAGYIGAQYNYRKIGAYMRGQTDEISPDNLKTISAMEAVTERNALNDDYLGSRKVAADFIPKVLGIDGGSELIEGFDYTDPQRAESVVNAINKAFVGKAIPDKSFMSVSLDGEDVYFKNYPVKITLQMPKGTRGLVTDNVKEAEFIAAKGSKMQILGAEIYHPDKYRGEKEYRIHIMAKLLN